ncbi:DEAD/DEAH box helicase [Spiroplasma endosymbiont of Glossina fuscipes fuscipes]|uniref:DEAD/DEAH box helicase n=1 Tax=Spiroplasma endosymbiont of Glossina fuscipes fuscipes TaxID=2004463 RepID=UPI003CF9C42C
MNFNTLNLSPALERMITKMGYTNLTEIQEKAIPVALNNQDIIGKSHTGTGKTAAFILPILQRLDPQLKRPQAIILCPTRELAMQVIDQVRKFATYLEGVNATLLCGGSHLQRQIYSLRKSNIVVGTPGRIADHINRNTLRLNTIKTIVLDEADEMLKMGFKTELDKVFENAPKKYQTLLFSATMPKQVLEIANKYQNNPVEIVVTRNATEQNNITQYYVDAISYRKEDVLIALYKNLQPKRSIIFSNTKAFTDKIAKMLATIGVTSCVINGDKRQRERLQAMRSFREGKATVLVATDVAARGIDIDQIDYVFNYDIPTERESYIHRIGRTARAGATGVAITIVSNRNDLNEIKHLAQYQKKKIELFDITNYNLKEKIKESKNFSGNYKKLDSKQNKNSKYSNSYGSSKTDRGNFNKSNAPQFGKNCKKKKKIAKNKLKFN